MSIPANNCVLITGASSGLGLEFSHVFANLGQWQNILLVARREEKLKKIKEKLETAYPKVKVHIKKTDLCNDSEISDLLRYIKEADLFVECLINNAGFGSYGLFKDLDLNRQLEMINLNCSAIVKLTSHFVPNMIERNSGYILNVSSMAGFQGLPFLSVYAATKAFVTSFSQALSSELKGHNIVVQALCPGPVATEFLHVSGFPSKISFLPSLSAKQVCCLAISRLLKRRTMVIPGFLNLILAQLPRIVPRTMASDIAMWALKKKF